MYICSVYFESAMSLILYDIVYGAKIVINSAFEPLNCTVVGDFK